MFSEPTSIDTPETVLLKHDWYHLKMAVFVAHVDAREIDTATMSLLHNAMPEEPPLEPDLWRVAGGTGWFIMIRKDIRDWLTENLGPYSLKGEYVAVILEGKKTSLLFRNHRNAVAFKMTWF